MPGFGDGSDGALNVLSGTHNLNLNQKYQFTSVNVSSGAILTTNNTTGSVLYILCQGEFRINGTLKLNGIVNYGNNTWGVTIDGDAFTSPGVASGGDGYKLGSNGGNGGNSVNGFGGGGGGAGLVGSLSEDVIGGDGGNGSSSFGSGGGTVTASQLGHGATVRHGQDATGSRGGGGGAYARFNRTSGNIVQRVTASGRPGGSSYGANGSDGTNTILEYVSGTGNGTYFGGSGGGGGAGGRAGRAGVHLVVKADTIIIGGTILTSGTAGQNGGNGGKRKDITTFNSLGGGPGGGGGGGNGGNVTLIATREIDRTGTVTRSGGSGGSAGGYYNGNTFNTVSSTYNGQGGSAGSLSEEVTGQFTSFTANFIMGGSVNRKIKAYRSFSAGFVMSGQVIARKITTVTEVDRKTYAYKVYDRDDNFLGEWTDVISEFGYNQEVNTAGSVVEVELARNSDTRFVQLAALMTEDGDHITTEGDRILMATTDSPNQIGPGSNVDLNYRVDVYVYYGEIAGLVTEDFQQLITEDGDRLVVGIGAPNGVRKFSGFISSYTSRYGNQETTRVRMTSFGWELDNYVIQDEGDTTVPYNSVDPADIARGVLDDYVGQGGVITYDSASIQDTGATVSYTFRLNTILEGLEKARQTSPTADWYWYLDMGQNLIYFRQKAGTPHHIFTLGKEIQSLELEQNIESITNLVYFSGGEVTEGVNLYRKHEDTDSQTDWRQGLQRISDQRVLLTDTADIISLSEIDRNKEPRYQTTLDILDSAYDIESIRPGDMVGFRNFGNYVDSLTMQVVGIGYSPDVATLHLDSLPPNLNKRIQDLRRNLDVINALENPDAPS